MKLIFVLSVIFCSALADDFIPNDWKFVKFPLEAPRYQEVLKEIFPESTDSPKINRGGRIAGGEAAKLGQFVHQALLMTRDVYGDDYICGGSIISHNWILTAAHCLDEMIKVSVYVGVVDRISGPAAWGMEVSDPSDMILHEGYTITNVLNDIALIRLVNTIKNDPNVGIVMLPKRADHVVNLDNQMAMISGFGRTTDTSGPSQFLRWVQAPIAANEKCEKTFGKVNVRDTNLCLDTLGGRSSCQGDSGGGLTVKIDERRVIAGIVSYGAAISCTKNYPAVYTRVTSYLDWIQSKTGIYIE